MAVGTPVITITNNADGTADVAVTGANGANTVTVYYAQVDDQWGTAPTWTSGGTTAGDGTVSAIATGNGVFWFYASETDGSLIAVSDPKNAWINSGEESVINQILDAVQSRIRTMALTGIASSDVIVLTSIDAKDIRDIEDSSGGIVIAPGGAEREVQSLNQRDDIAYPVVIAAIVAANESNTRAFRETWMLHRERIRKAFINQGLTVADGEVNRAILRPVPSFDQRAWAKMKLVSPILFDFQSRETRGI